MNVSSSNKKVGLFIPTLNAGNLWKDVLNAISKQSILLDRKIIVDCNSDDNTALIAKEYGFSIHNIPRSEFDHGKTRNLAFRLCRDCDIVIFLTQDVILNDEFSIEQLIRPFESDEQFSIVYGKQIPHLNANPISKFERYNNYGDTEIIQQKSAIKQMGFGVCFCSNAFAAYNVKDALEMGGFPEKVIFGEDACLTAKLVLNNKKVMYNPMAVVQHSHNYSFKQQFMRYFDVGVFFRDEEWITKAFGKPNGKAILLTLKGFSYLFPNKILWLPQYILILFAKILGHKLGKIHKILPVRIKLLFTMNKSYWE